MKLLKLERLENGSPGSKKSSTYFHHYFQSCGFLRAAYLNFIAWLATTRGEPLSSTTISSLFLMRKYEERWQERLDKSIKIETNFYPPRLKLKIK